MVPDITGEFLVSYHHSRLSRIVDAEATSCLRSTSLADYTFNLSVDVFHRTFKFSLHFDRLITALHLIEHKCSTL